MIETALISLFTANAAVNALISGRICPFTDGNLLALPRLTYWRSNCQRPMSNDGPTGQAIATFQIDAWAVDGLTAYQLLDSCRQAANGFSGTVAGVKIDSIRFEDQNDQINVQVPTGLGGGDDVFVEFLTDAADINQIQIPYGSAFRRGDAPAQTTSISRIAAARTRARQRMIRRAASRPATGSGS